VSYEWDLVGAKHAGPATYAGPDVILTGQGIDRQGQATVACYLFAIDRARTLWAGVALANPAWCF
jgi:hypothetical protein